MIYVNTVLVYIAVLGGAVTYGTTAQIFDAPSWVAWLLYAALAALAACAVGAIFLPIQYRKWMYGAEVILFVVATVIYRYPIDLFMRSL